MEILHGMDIEPNEKSLKLRLGKKAPYILDKYKDKDEETIRYAMGLLFLGRKTRNYTEITKLLDKFVNFDPYIIKKIWDIEYTLFVGKGDKKFSRKVIKTLSSESIEPFFEYFSKEISEVDESKIIFGHLMDGIGLIVRKKTMGPGNPKISKNMKC